MSNKVRMVGDLCFYRGHFVCPYLKSSCFFHFMNRIDVLSNKLYTELSNTDQLDKPFKVDRYYLYFYREYPIKLEGDYIAVCKDCWKDFLMYRLAREGI